MGNPEEGLINMGWDLRGPGSVHDNAEMYGVTSRNTNDVELYVPNDARRATDPFRSLGEDASYLQEMRHSSQACVARVIGLLMFLLGAGLFVYCAIDTARTKKAEAALRKQCTKLGIAHDVTGKPNAAEHKGRKGASAASKQDVAARKECVREGMEDAMACESSGMTREPPRACAGPLSMAPCEEFRAPSVGFDREDDFGDMESTEPSFKSLRMSSAPPSTGLRIGGGNR